MIKNLKLFKEFEDNFTRSQKLPFSSSMKIFEAMRRECITFGILPSKDPLEGIDVDIKIARVLNLCLKKSLQK